MKTTVLALRRADNLTPKSSLDAVMTVAGSDSSGGAGIEADLKTFSAFGVYGMTCITALTAQNTTGVKTFDKTSRSLVHEILTANLDDMLFGYDRAEEAPLKAIKTGMLTEEAIRELVAFLPRINEYDVKLVIDPVMVSTSGSKLSDDEGMALCVKSLIPGAALLTPNFPEAEALFKLTSGADKEVDIKSLDDLVEFVIALQKALKCKNLLVKGGHIPFTQGDVPAKGWKEKNLKIKDVLYESEEDKVTIFESDYIDSTDNHGSGCTLASAIAANIAKGLPLDESIAVSIDFIHRGMTSLKKKLGAGNGPLNHNVAPVQKVSSIMKGLNETPKLIVNGNDTFLDYLINHPKVRDNWKAYTQHPFVKALAENKLPFENFVYYLKQDYHYLVNYAQVQSFAGAVAPTYQQTHAQATIIGEIVTEIEKHQQRLSKHYNIDYERDMDFDVQLGPGPACIAYCNYLIEASKTEDFLGIKTAVSPCLHGYAAAGVYGQKIRKNTKDLGVVTEEQSKVYQSWLDEYSSEWYIGADLEGRKALQLLIQDVDVNDKRIEELVDIFNDVTKLEIGFWDECLNL
ncbi:Hydroxymethylpyrimidine/phosphomethylpyrimidine kinase THI20 [Candida viswanathii]|uniref:Hydroxymethylpyrimidine/phosphomethylpyrimidine kinase THI20 n=1 Tax=Candida viswanathii TaxID=5486 RepID=A0A367YPW4_9ASCO|nr:Hydroxymethylpyrimidine/phosphomethylpyrimidine kinase THI20 [Candida viswanathii]